MPQAQRRGISSSSAPKWLPGIRKPLFCRTVVAPECTKGFGYPFAGVSTGQFASAYILTNYERECADPLVFERGLARGRAEPSDFEGRSAHTLIKLIDLEKDTKERMLTPWIDNLAFPQQACRTKSLETRRNMPIFTPTRIDMESIDTSNMCSHLQRKLFEKEGVYHPLWTAVLDDPELTAVVRSRQLHIYRNGKKVLVLAGKAAPKVIREDKICAFLPKV